MTTRAVVYVRISRDREGSGLGVARQEKECRALVAQQRGWEVAEVIVDNDMTAYRAQRRRPGYERLLEGLRARSWGAVVAWHPDRLHRSNKELEPFIDVIEATGAKVATVRAGIVDLSTAAGRLSARVVGAAAQYESEVKAERIRSKHVELAEAGEPGGGGSRPFGYLPDRRTLDPVEAPLVREAAQRVLDGVAVRAICRDWNDRGVATVSGARWTSHVLRRLLIAPRTAGIRDHGGRTFEGTWEPLLDRVTWHRVCAVLTEPGRRVNSSPRTYLLTGGVARCGLCGAALVARPRSDKRRSYVCASGPGFHGCGKIRALAEPLEEWVRLRALAAVEGSAFADPDDGSTALVAALEDVRAALGELAADYYSDRSISKAQFQAASTKLSEREAGLLAQIAVTVRRQRVPTAEAVTAALADPGEPTPERRAAITAMVDRVVVGPAVRGRNTFDPDRVQIEWAAA